MGSRGRFDPQTNFIFQSPKTITVIFTLLPFLSEDIQIEILDIFIVLLEECSIDNSMAASVGLVQTINNLLAKHQKFSLNVIQKLIYLIGIVGSFSVSARELKTLIRLMRTKTPENERKADDDDEGLSLDKDLSPLILEVIRKMSRYDSPSSFFSFDGIDCGIVSDNILFPSNGYTFSCWLRIERTTKSQCYRFFSFFDKKMNGLELLFKGNHMCVQVVSGGKKQQNVTFDYFFHTNRWYFISLTQNKRFMLRSDIILFVDGEQKQTFELKYPSLGGQVNFAHFCTNIPVDNKQTKVQAFCGQVGPISIFDKVFSLNEVQKIHSCGPDFQYTFKKGDSQPRYFDWPNAESFSQKLVTLYNPRSSTKDFKCPDNSGTKKGFSTDARLLQGTSIFVTHPVKDTLNCIGGVEVLFPLFRLLKKDWTVDYSMCARTISLITEMLRNNKKNQEDMIQKNSLCTLGHILGQIPPEHINHDTLKALQGLVECSSDPKDPIIREIFKEIFLNFELWITVDFDIHSNMLHFLHDEVSKNPEYFHETVGIQYLLDVMRYFFWYKPEKEPERIYQPTVRPKEEEVYALRLQLTEIIKAMIRSGINKSEAESIMSYIVDSTDEKQVVEILKWVLVLIDEEVPNIIEALSEEKIMLPLLNMLTNNKKKIRIFSLKLIGKILERSNSERRQKFKNLGYYLLMEQFLLSENCFDEETYIALLEIILCKISFTINSTISTDLSKGGAKILLPDLLTAFFNLVTTKSIDTKEKAIQDMSIILKSNPYNRTIFGQQFGWQNWVLSLAIPDADEPVEKAFSLFESAVDVVSVVLSEFLQAPNGYKQVKETLYQIDIICDRKEIHRTSAYIIFFKRFLPFIVNQINNTQFNKEQDFWRNLFRITLLVENFILTSDDTKFESPQLEGTIIKLDNTHNEKLYIVKYIMQGFDYIIKMSIKDPKAMDLLHYDGFKKNNNPFIIQTIMNIAADLTTTKSNIPTPSLFFVLFRLQLFLLCELDEKEIQEAKHSIRMLALLSNDIKHTRVPKPTFKTENDENEISQARVFYALAKLFVKIEQKQYSLIPIITAILRKNQRSLAAILTNPVAKEYLQSELACIEQDAAQEEFILSLESEEGWLGVRQSPPFSAVYTEVKMEEQNQKEKILKKREQKVNDILKFIERNASNDIPKLKKATQEASNAKTHVCFTELQRMNNWRDALRRKSKIALTEWRKHEAEFFSGTGVWIKDEDKEDLLMFLDPTENSKRMRMRVVMKTASKNERNVSQKTEAAQEDDDWSCRSELVSSFVHTSRSEPQKTPGEDQATATPGHDDEHSLGVSDDEDVVSEEDGEATIPNENEESDWETINKAPKEGLHLEREEEETVLIVPCELVVSLDTIKGTFEITNKHIYFIVNPDAETKEKENVAIETLKEAFDQKWPIEEIYELYKRRYLLRYTSIEIFFLNRTAFFFNFDKAHVDAVIKTIVNQKPPNLKFHAYSLTPNALLKKSKLTQKWQRREISNFEYLMGLNTFANRTYNDLTQYPVFPWVIKDYNSDVLDLNDPSIYRDLSKPVGALNEKRLKNILERYEAFQDQSIPKFHYGSHYSSVGVVLFFLLRLEPFTSYNIKLQGGQFDLPDRLFHSLPVSWENCMTSNSDVKELIPEFFYMPEFLRNNNGLNLGVKQNKEVVNDVILPPWAKTPEEFIRINREALESEYVSSHLHEWIDLIFGYKQTGVEAEKAHNLFYYLTYEGSVDLDAVDDPLQRKAIETQISNFGQTPSQLFKKPHPQRLPKPTIPKPEWRPNAFVPTFSSSIASVTTGGNSNDLLFVQHIKSEDKVVVVDCNRQLFQLSKLKPKPTLIATVGSPFAKDENPNFSNFVCSRDGKWIFSCGHFDKSIKCSAMFDKLIVKQSIFHHTDIVTCLAMTSDGKFLVSGSADATVNVYGINYMKLKPNALRTQVKDLMANVNLGTAASVVDDLQFSSIANKLPIPIMVTNKDPLTDQPLCILYGHEASVLCVDVSADLDIVASGDTDGCVLIHTLSEGTYIRTIEHPLRNTLHIVKISSDGHLLMHSETDCSLHLFTINGKHIKSLDVNDRLKSIEITPDAKYAICGGIKKQVTIRRLYDLAELHTFETCTSEIKAITLAHPTDDYYREVVVALADGTVHFYPIDPDLLDAPRDEYDSDSENALNHSYQLV